MPRTVERKRVFRRFSMEIKLRFFRAHYVFNEIGADDDEDFFWSSPERERVKAKAKLESSVREEENCRGYMCLMQLYVHSYSPTKIIVWLALSLFKRFIAAL